ncbi:MAG: HU family DNA-binding protein [Thermotogae bacterium]|nr:HU family DNA-binding protein [Thermotogota bacterium]
MNKTDVIDKVSKATGMKKKDSKVAVEAVLNTISGALSKGEKVQLIGFGTFEVRRRKARDSINPQTRKKIKIPSKKVPKFRPGKALREMVK